MKPGRASWLAACAVLRMAAGVAHAADTQDGDLDLIPQTLGQATAADAPATPASLRLYLEESPSARWVRDDLAVPQPAADSPRDELGNRVSLDAQGRWNLGGGVSASLGNRFNLFNRSDYHGDSSHSFRNDLREALLSWEALPRSYVEAGRINQRAGVALGYNPTDFFRSRAQVSLASLDPSVQRENRLGSAMLRTQCFWDGGSLSLLYAPRLESPEPLDAGTPEAFDPQLDRTNGSDRVLLSLGLERAQLSPQLLMLREHGQTRLGLNLSRGLGRQVVLYAEWAGGRQYAQAEQALQFAQRSGELTAEQAAQLPEPPGGSRRRFRNDVAAGASWTGESRLTLNLEYHYHEAGFGQDEWQQWFDAGRAADTAVRQQLWYLRAYAGDQQDPMSRHRVFLRADWNDAFVQHLELSGFAITEAAHGSGLAQLAANYAWTQHWSFGAYLAGTYGSSRSEFGSLPDGGSITLSAIRYF